MTDKTMPERIFLQGDAEDLDDVSWGRDRIWEDDVEYVRADLAQGDANEPLANGQFRWAKRYKIKCIWVMTRVVIDSDGTPFLISHDGIARKASSYAIIGHVIRPPEED